MRNEPKEELPEMPEPTKVMVTLRPQAEAGRPSEQREVIFEHASVVNLSQAGVIVHNVEGRVIGYFPYEVVESVVAPDADKPKGKIVIPEAVVSLH
jgi:hypothetical protein